MRRNAFFAVLLLCATPALAQSDAPVVTDSISTMSISLQAGENLIGFPLWPADRSVASIMQPVEDNLILVQDDQGNYYIPARSINTIGDWKWYEGYRVVMRAPDVLTITGPTIIPELNPIPIGN